MVTCIDFNVDMLMTTNEEEEKEEKEEQQQQEEEQEQEHDRGDSKGTKKAPNIMFSYKASQNLNFSPK